VTVANGRSSPRGVFSETLLSSKGSEQELPCSSCLAALFHSFTHSSLIPGLNRSHDAAVQQLHHLGLAVPLEMGPGKGRKGPSPPPRTPLLLPFMRAIWQVMLILKCASNKAWFRQRGETSFFFGWGVGDDNIFSLFVPLSFLLFSLHRPLMFFFYPVIVRSYNAKLLQKVRLFCHSKGQTSPFCISGCCAFCELFLLPVFLLLLLLLMLLVYTAVSPQPRCLFLLLWRKVRAECIKQKYRTFARPFLTLSLFSFYF
jgi:hypothetical protein